ncbi:MAG: HAD-IC family P-type ATPase, partial [Defluviitaleaceae bacterium]|nr:HAD-IC family P-type ATPase [Defluviitaleaceae bacterium]
MHTQDITTAIESLKSNADTGLSNQEAEIRLEKFGANRLASPKKKSILKMILAQFKDFLVLILLAAAVISIVTGHDLVDAIIIIGILVINMVIGITQENRADNALKELKDLSAPLAKVRRDGRILKIDSGDLVVGDIVMLDSGDYIPADIRIIESMNLRVDESALTGESVPVEKNAAAILSAEAPLGDRINSGYMGTMVNYGRGMGIVCAIGMDTEMGKIASILNNVPEEPTPLQTKLNSMAKVLGIVCILICALIFGIGFLYNMDIREMFMVSVSLAVAAVPEGIAIVVTIILAIGVQKMVKSNVIVKKMRAVETLGSTTVICSDKTGTLTQNKMTVVKLFDFENVYDVSGTGYNCVGEITPSATPSVQKMAEIALLCNDSIYDRERERIIGDPTEGAMLVFGEKLNINRENLQAKFKRIQEIPFDSERKLMSTYNREITDDVKPHNLTVINTKGAPDQLIGRCAFYYKNGEIKPLTNEIKTKLLQQNENFAASALRVLAFAFRHLENTEIENIENPESDLVYVGMMCMIDPPREEAKAAVSDCHRAGIDVKMITGDHKITACAIAESLGISKPGQLALDGLEIGALSDEELKKKVAEVNVFARVSPEHKVRIVTAIKENGNIVAMTGDGVNDAPSLKKADIGIAMGITGTDVSKEAADMVLTDDNFVSIV